MTNVPHYMNVRGGLKYGGGELIDGIQRDGLKDAYNDTFMGDAAEVCAVDHEVTREQQDDFAIASYQKAQKAHAEGKFLAEIVPFETPAFRGKPGVVISVDEESKNVSYGGNRELKKSQN